jgi:RNA polymerase sigma factor (sigma-70 family)
VVGLIRHRPETHDPDAELLASQEDPERFEHVVTAHFPEIYRYLANRTGPTMGEDLAAETFEIGFRIRERYDPDKGNARAWLYGIAHNLLSNHRRSERRRLNAYARTGSFEELLVADDVTARVDADHELLRVAAAMAQLDDAQRDALYLVAVAELSDQEAADALGIPIGTLKSRVSRGRSRLRSILAQVAPDADTRSSGIGVLDASVEKRHA